jgi:hypothetical protein
VFDFVEVKGKDGALSSTEAEKLPRRLQGSYAIEAMAIPWA